MEQKSYSIPKVQAEYDYTKFNILDRNRAINKSHVKKLADDIKEHGLQIPLIVNEHMDVIDGQHRLAALASIGYPALYYVRKGTDVQDIGRLNTLQNKWSESDWIHNFAKGGHKSYQLLEKLKEKYASLPYRTIAYAFKSNNFDAKALSKGTLEIADDELKDGKEALKYLDKFSKILSDVPGSTRSFCCAVLWCAHHGDRIDLQRMQKRVCKDIQYAKAQYRIADWIDWFEYCTNKYSGDYQPFLQIYKQELYKFKKSRKSASRKKTETAVKKTRKPTRKVRSFDADLFRSILGENAKIVNLADTETKAS